MEQKQHKPRPKADSSMPGWKGSRGGYGRRKSCGRYGDTEASNNFTRAKSDKKRNPGGSHGIMRD